MLKLPSPLQTRVNPAWEAATFEMRFKGDEWLPPDHLPARYVDPQDGYKDVEENTPRHRSIPIWQYRGEDGEWHDMKGW